MNTYAGGASESASLVITFFNLDQSGHLLKLSQMQKIYVRFRMISINHGPYLENYFQSSAEKFDPPSSLAVDDIQRSSFKLYSGMLRYKVALHIFEANMIRVVFYLTSWLLKIVSFILLEMSAKSGRIHRTTCYFVFISQKVHMIALNVVALDVIVYTTRVLL